jgi:adenosylmethionine-8-amino-7-oxononanoate aminotransferase
VLLIADEVVTGFGRTGHMSYMAALGVRPDILVLAKGITSGYMPLGAAGMSQEIAEAFESSGDFFAHGFTFSGHAAACAAALKNIEILEREELGSRASTVGRYLHEQLVELAGRHEIIGEVRGGEVGQLHGLDLVADRDTGALHDPTLRVADLVHAAARRRGLIVRPMAGYMIGMSPPLIIERDDCDFIVTVLDEALREVTDSLPRA